MDELFASTVLGTWGGGGHERKFLEIVDELRVGHWVKIMEKEMDGFSLLKNLL